MQKIQDQLARKNSKDNSKKMRDKIILLNTKLSRVCDLHKEIAIICQTKMNSKQITLIYECETFIMCYFDY